MADNLRAVFNQIAPAWYNLRHHTIFRRELQTVAAEWRGGRLLNIGCGHGPDFVPFAGSFGLYGVDFSEEMLRLALRYAAKNGFTANLTVANAIALPYASGAFDWAIAIATYHHLMTADRLPAFLELKRVLKPGGSALITVWNRWQPRFWSGRREVLVPWRTKSQTLYRYYNLFSYRESVTLARRAGFDVRSVHPESAYRFPLKFFSRNICLLVKKPA